MLQEEAALKLSKMLLQAGALAQLPAFEERVSTSNDLWIEAD
jgi:hypothetical protein